jgi:hypothetical protein
MSPIKTHRGKRQTVLRPRRGEARVRGADGNVIEQIELIWPTEDEGEASMATVTVREDFAPIERAITAMEEDAIAGRFDGFSSRPFRRASLMSALFSRLGVKSMPWCCLDQAGMPPPVMESVQQPLIAASGDPTAAALKPFYQYCAACHQTAERFPPNFLVGATQRVGANLAQCAERLLVRLSMWQVAPDARAKSPMPPVNAVHGVGYSEEAWRDGEELVALKRYVENVLKKQTGNMPHVNELLGRGYENLRSCLPEPGSSP